MQNTLTRDKKISDITRKHVIGELREIFSDPDFGLPLRPQAILRLKKSLRSKTSGRYRNLLNILD